MQNNKQIYMQKKQKNLQKNFQKKHLEGPCPRHTGAPEDLQPLPQPRPPEQPPNAGKKPSVPDLGRLLSPRGCS